MSIFSKLFKKQKTEDLFNESVIRLSSAIDSSTENKENIEDFILILEQIQETIDATVGKEKCEFKSYKQRTRTIKNMIEFALEKYNKKIEE